MGSRPAAWRRCRRRDDALAAAPARSACGRSASSSGTGDVSPTKGLVATTAGRHQAGSLGDLGGLPRRQLARPDLRVRLPGEHRRLADVRVAAAAGAGRLDRPGPGHVSDAVADQARVHDQARRPSSGTATRSPPPTWSTAWTARPTPSSAASTAWSSAGCPRSRRPAATRSRSRSSSRTTGWRANSPRCPASSSRRAFAEKQGKNYGTPAGSIMCTGAYKLKSWTPGRRRDRRGQPALLEQRGQARWCSRSRSRACRTPPPSPPACSPARSRAPTRSACPR